MSNTIARYAIQEDSAEFNKYSQLSDIIEEFIFNILIFIIAFNRTFMNFHLFIVIYPDQKNLPCISAYP